MSSTSKPLSIFSMESMLRHQTIPSIKTSFINPIYKPNLPNSDSSFPVFTIVALSIIVTALLLLSYCIVVIKCCSNQPQLSIIRWFSLRCHPREEDSFIALSPTTWQQGLDGSAIRGIPVFHYKAGEGDHRSFYGCAVCLNEFLEQDKLRILPSCGHAFHLDCIDVWLQGNSNCPLCRMSISGANRYPNDSIIAPSSSPQGSLFYSDSLMGGDEDFVIIELRRDESDEDITNQAPEQCATPRDFVATSKHKARRHGSIMGDECIDLRDQDEFSIQPIRRSFSLNSAADRQLYMTVQTTLNNKQQREVSSRSDQGNDSGRRSLCRLLSHGRGSKTTVRPFNFEI